MITGNTELVNPGYHGSRTVVSHQVDDPISRYCIRIPVRAQRNELDMTTDRSMS